MIVKRRKKVKIGGVFGHFFTDLSPVIKKLILERINDNKKRIQKESFLSPAEIAKILKKNNKKNRNGEYEDFDFSGGLFIDEIKEKTDDFRPRTNITIMRDKVALLATRCDYDCGTINLNEMLEEIYLLTKKIERIAIGVQRMRRIKIVQVHFYATFKFFIFVSN